MLKKIKRLEHTKNRKLGRLSKNYGGEKKKASGSSEFTTELFQISQKKQFLSHTLFQRWNLPATAAKSLQSCPTLCDPIDLSILQRKYRINFSHHMPAITEHGCEGEHSLPKALPRPSLLFHSHRVYC